MDSSPAEVAARVLASHLATLAVARGDLARVRAAVLPAPEDPVWWPFRASPALPPAEDRLAETMRHRACLRDLAARLEIDEGTLRSVRHALAPPPRLPDGAQERDAALALDELLAVVLEVRASATALEAVCDEAVRDLECALAEDGVHDRQALLALLRSAEQRVLRVVRDAEDHAPIWSERLDPLVHHFDATPLDSPERAAAEREIVAVLAAARARRAGSRSNR